jgi:hypothetical protein
LNAKLEEHLIEKHWRWLRADEALNVTNFFACVDTLQNEQLPERDFPHLNLEDVDEIRLELFIFELLLNDNLSVIVKLTRIVNEI